MKKYLFLSVIGICAVFGVYRWHDNHLRQRTLMSAKENIKMIHDLSQEILTDYYKNTGTAISSGKAYDKNNDYSFCYNADYALRQRYVYFIKNGYMLALDSLYVMAKAQIDTLCNKYSGNDNEITSIVKLYSISGSEAEETGFMANKEPAFTSYNNLGEYIAHKNSEFSEEIKLTEASVKLNDEEVEKKLSGIKAYNSAHVKEKYKEISIMHKNIAVKRGMRHLADGIYYKVLKNGKGRTVGNSPIISANCSPTLFNGRKLSTGIYGLKEVPIKALLYGYQDVLKKMRKGDKWEVFIPYDQAYGEEDCDGKIPPYSDIIDTLEITDIK